MVLFTIRYFFLENKLVKNTITTYSIMNHKLSFN